MFKIVISSCLNVPLIRMEFSLFWLVLVLSIFVGIRRVTLALCSHLLEIFFLFFHFKTMPVFKGKVNFLYTTKRWISFFLFLKFNFLFAFIHYIRTAVTSTPALTLTLNLTYLHSSQSLTNLPSTPDQLPLCFLF